MECQIIIVGQSKCAYECSLYTGAKGSYVNFDPTSMSVGQHM